MATRLSRVAHFSGEGLPAPIDVWRANLDDTCAGEVYFTQPYDRSDQWPTLTVAMVETVVCNEQQWETQLEFETGSEQPIPLIYKAMLAHAAIYFTDVDNEICAISEASMIEKNRKVSHTLRMANIYRSRYLPEPLEESL